MNMQTHRHVLLHKLMHSSDAHSTLYSNVLILLFEFAWTTVMKEIADMEHHPHCVGSSYITLEPKRPRT